MVSWKTLSIVFAILIVVVAVVLGVFFYMASSSANYWKSQYSSLQSQYSTLHNQYSTLYNQCQILQSKYNTLQVQYNTLNTNYTSLKTNYGNLQVSYGNLKNQYESLQSQYSSLQSQYNALESNYTTLKVSCSNLQNQYSSLQSQYNSLKSNYTALTNQYNSLQSQYANLQSQYSSLQGQYSELNSRYQALQAQYGPLLQLITNSSAFLTSFPLVFLGANGTLATKQWPRVIGNSILLAPNASSVGGAVLAPFIYIPTSGPWYTWNIHISGNATSLGGPSWCRLADGYTVYLLIKPSNLLNNTFGTSESLSESSTGFYSFGGNVIIPYSPSPYIIIQWDPWSSSVTAYVVDWYKTPNTTGIQTSGAVILWENSQHVSLPSLPGENITYPLPGEELVLYVQYNASNGVLSITIMHGNRTLLIGSGAGFTIPPGLIQLSPGVSVYYVGVGSQTGMCYANWYLNEFRIRTELSLTVLG